MAKINDTFGDERLKKDAGSSVRGSRASADVDRVQEDGTAMSVAQRRQLLRQQSVQEVLPSPPVIPGYHCCWLSTTNSTDPIFRRLQKGYVPVKADEVKSFGGEFVAKGGEYDGCISCNEMLLFKIPLETYEDLMTIYHHDIPLEQEQALRETVFNKDDTDSDGRRLGQVEGEFDKLGRGASRNPTFIS